MNIKKITTLCIVFLVSLSAMGQNNTTSLKANENENLEKEYNKWSFNVNAGSNVAVRPFNDGYYSLSSRYKEIKFSHIDLNVRKMFNEKFGLRLGLTYDNFTAGPESPYFDNNMYGANIQGILNLHRVLNWEEFTDTFGLQFHFGTGVSLLGASKTVYPKDEKILSVLGGVTLLVKLNDKLAFNLDYSGVSNISQHVTFDGENLTELTNGNGTGLLYTGSVGLTYYFGKKEKHADWYWVNEKEEKEELLSRIEELETLMNDTDRDGVPDYLDVENNTTTGVAVDTKGRAVDLNYNGIPDELESYVNASYSELQKSVNELIGGDSNYTSVQMREMINGNYLNVFFDFDAYKVNANGVSTVNFLIQYLNNNPKSKVEIIGYADESGSEAYNKELSQKRAESVVKMMTNAGINKERMNIVVKGTDDTVKDSKVDRKLVRRVEFRVD